MKDLFHNRFLTDMFQTERPASVETLFYNKNLI